MQQSEVMAQTAQWISVWVIDEGLCPFAKEPWTQQRVRLLELDASCTEALLGALADEVQRLETTLAQELETSLLILPRALADFDDFLDFVAMAEDLLGLLAVAERYQLVGFHPDYCFEGSSPDDRANATNQSPYPILQILRQASVNAVLRDHPDPSSIYERNIAHLRAMNPQRWAMLRRNNDEDGGEISPAGRDA